jgi:hypothetical protein
MEANESPPNRQSDRPLKLTAMAGRSKNSWMSPMSLQANNLVDSQEFSGKESFWLCLLSMLAGVFPVTSTTTFKVSHLRWALFPAVLMVMGLYLLISKTIFSIEQGLEIASFPENTTAAKVNDKKVILGSNIWVMTMALIVLAGPMSLSLSRKKFVDNFPPELLHWFGGKAKGMCIGCASFFIVILLVLLLGPGRQSDPNNLLNFLFLPIAGVWVSAFVSVLCLRSYVFTKAHFVHYEEIRKLADQDSVTNIATSMINGKKHTTRLIQAYLQGPLVVIITLIFISLIPGSYLLFKSAGTTLDAFTPIVAIFIVFEIFALLEPIRALSKISQMATNLELKIAMHERLETVEVAALLARFPHIFPYVTLYGVPVTQANLVAVIAAAAAPLAGKIVSFLSESL